MLQQQSGSITTYKSKGQPKSREEIDRVINFAISLDELAEQFAKGKEKGEIQCLKCGQMIQVFNVNGRFRGKCPKCGLQI
ncbi:hypothetical protein SDD30_15230 [Moorella naiadis]|uniref:hypothetical protein n=1 Tax=Moorella naiadis (nom. illeg.) TaxID=3093670 RepID=UPI003D9C88C9